MAESHERVKRVEWRRRQDLNLCGFLTPTVFKTGPFSRSGTPPKLGGDGRIRTSVPFRETCFRDRRLQPLGHISLFQSTSHLLSFLNYSRIKNRHKKRPRGGDLLCFGPQASRQFSLKVKARLGSGKIIFILGLLSLLS